MQKGKRMDERPGFNGHAHVNGKQLLPQVVALADWRRCRRGNERKSRMHNLRARKLARFLSFLDVYFLLFSNFLNRPRRFLIVFFVSYIVEWCRHTGYDIELIVRLEKFVDSFCSSSFSSVVLKHWNVAASKRRSNYKGGGFWIRADIRIYSWHILIIGEAGVTIRSQLE